MDALLILKEQHGFTEGDVRKIVVHIPKVHLNNLMHHDPRDPIQAKFSMEYALAVSLHSGNCPLQDFTPEAVMRPEVRALFDLVELDPVDKLKGEFPTTVEVHLKNGAALEKTMAMPMGQQCDAVHRCAILGQIRRLHGWSFTIRSKRAVAQRIGNGWTH